MSKKFTEEQYNMLVEIQEDQYSDDLFFESKSYENSIAYTVAQKYDVLKLFIDTNDLGNEAVALMNPLTREWAHERFVEEEKKYVWTLKTDNTSVINKDLSFWYLDKSPTIDKYFSEKEIENSPFKPDYFDKEEVD